MPDLDLRIFPDALDVIIDAGAATDPDFSAGNLGKLFDIADGRTYRYVRVHDPNDVNPLQGDPMGYRAGDITDGFDATADITESDAGLFAGILEADTADASPDDNDEVFIQVNGFRETLNINPTSDTTINAGDGLIWDADHALDRQTSASNDIAGKLAVTTTGMTTGDATTLAGYITGLVN